MTRALYFREYRAKKAMVEGVAKKPFVGVDGEGGTKDGKHAYYLLRFGDSLLYKSGVALTTFDCLNFLHACGTAEPCLPIAFFFNYDVTMILRDLPRDIIESVLDRDSRSYVTAAGKQVVYMAKWEEFYIDYMPGRNFEVGKIDSTTNKMRKVTISDVSGFYQCSFVKALKTWKIGTPETWKRIEDEKARRSEFTGTYSDAEIAYNKEECELLVALVSELQMACYHANIRPSRWQGAGCLAAAIHKSKKTPRSTDTVLSQEVSDAAQSAFFGGRFEASQIGAIQGDDGIHEADISSAYPYAMTKLPCLVHGEWRQGKTLPDHPHFLARIRWTVDADVIWCPFQFRAKDGKISAPRRGIGWHHGWEILEAVQHAGVHIEVLDVLELVQQCECKMFDWIPDIFAQRLTLGAQGQGIVLKFGLNSLYGKLAQSVGAAPYANPYYAGAITSVTRAMLYEAIRKQGGDDVVMVATDAVYMRSAPKFHCSEIKTLGGWEAQKFGSLFIVQPGLYYCGETEKIKTRGLPQRLLAGRIDTFKEAWLLSGWSAKVPIEIPASFIGLRESHHRNKPELAGQWIKEVREVRFAPVKREPGDIIDGCGYTRAKIGKHVDSAIYKRVIGHQPLRSVLHDAMDTHTGFPEHPDGTHVELDQNLSEF